jgi:hypothetical protein
MTVGESINEDPELLEVIWFTNSRGSVGVAAVKTAYSGVKFYISPVDGFNAAVDSNLIMNLGARFPDAAGHTLFNGRYA